MGACKKIYNGSSSLWFDLWILNTSNFKLICPRNIIPSVWRVEHLFNEDGSWNKEMLYMLFDQRTINALINIPRTWIPEDDKQVWLRSMNGEYSTKMTFRLFFKEKTYKAGEGEG